MGELESRIVQVPYLATLSPLPPISSDADTLGIVLMAARSRVPLGCRVEAPPKGGWAQL